MLKMMTRFAMTVFLLMALLEAAFAAGVPTTLSYQGSLTDKGGSGISGSRTLAFSLYGVATGGSASWTEQQALTVTSGKFSAILGVTAPLDVSVLGGDTWLGIAVQGEPEMTPRQKLTSVAYALKAAVAESTDNIIPAGTVVAFAGNMAPSGWLMCNTNIPVSRTTYARLFAAIGTAHGTGDDSTTFHLPDYRGRFLRGVDGTAGLDIDKAGRGFMNAGGATGNNIGSVQGDQFASHTHTIVAGGEGFYPGDASSFFPTVSTLGSKPTLATGGNETRPKNAYVNWIIKY
jgi:microcystin-dependent protein